MGENINITYEVLFDLLRREKSREEIQKLDNTFFKDVLNYLKQKQSFFKDSEFSTVENEKTKIQVQNIKKILKELYDKRERKILNLAIYRARVKSNIIDTVSLLKEEKIMFEKLSELLSMFRTGILENLLEEKEPSVDFPEEKKSKQEFKKTEESAVNTPEEKEESSAETERAEMEDYKNSEDKENNKKSEPTIEDKTKDQPKDMKTIHFLQAVPKFLGEELEIYGPFQENDIASLPSQIADVIINKGRAEEIRSA